VIGLFPLLYSDSPSIRRVFESRTSRRERKCLQFGFTGCRLSKTANKSANIKTYQKTKNIRKLFEQRRAIH